MNTSLKELSKIISDLESERNSLQEEMREKETPCLELTLKILRIEETIEILKKKETKAKKNLSINSELEEGEDLIKLYN